MDKSIYWEAFLTINIGRGKKQRKTIANSNLFQRNELVFQILFNTFSQSIADFECLDFKRSFQGLWQANCGEYFVTEQFSLSWSCWKYFDHKQKIFLPNISAHTKRNILRLKKKKKKKKQHGDSLFSFIKYFRRMQRRNFLNIMKKQQ